MKLTPPEITPKLPQSLFRFCRDISLKNRQVVPTRVIGVVTAKGHEAAENSHGLVTRSQLSPNVEKPVSLSDTDESVNDYVHN
jgi:hypothetical protein